MDTPITEASIDSIKKVQISTEQERHIKAVFAQAKAAGDRMNQFDIVPINNNVILECIENHSQEIYDPNKGESGVGFDAIRVFKVADKVKNNFPDIKEGLECQVNLRAVMSISGGPAASIRDEVAQQTRDYYVCNAEMIQYLWAPKNG